ncbi:hypothetical protein [Streptomyces natalensis]|uniref:Aldo/keto reductase n=1 Tax=Streptomyces natalensis ATCC 27448 TaxID=1240678 RepID=A0A0D7CGK9_9ACTN|nr:hypothetical protein SNA_27550 [Streptomyces natalensis ATCC 27448]
MGALPTPGAAAAQHSRPSAPHHRRAPPDRRPAPGHTPSAIPGTKRRRYLEENVAATTVTITDEDLAAIEAVAPHGIVSGDRYAPALMQNLNG